MSWGLPIFTILCSILVALWLIWAEVKQIAEQGERRERRERTDDEVHRRTA